MRESLSPGDKVIIADSCANREHTTENGMVMIYANKIFIVETVRNDKFYPIKIVGIKTWWAAYAWIKQKSGFSLEELE